MKKSISCIFALIFTLTSCNLFIEDEPEVDEYGFSNVPVHSGEGYDAPVTTTDGNCQVTYQLKSNVRQLDLEDTRKWITYVEQDNSGLFLEIHYSGHTPQDRLPVPGEILLSTDVQVFPMGCMHRVQMRELRGGEYCYIASLAELDATYSQLDINGSVTTKSLEEYDVTAEEEEDTTAAAPMLTRADYSDPSWNNIAGLHVKFSGGEAGFGFDFPTTPFINLTDASGASIQAGFLEGSNYTITQKLDFDDFSLTRNSYKIHYEKTEDVTLKLKVAGAYNGSVKLAHFRPVKGQPVMVGPVVIVFFVNLNFDVEFNLAGEATFQRKWNNTVTFDIDLANPSSAHKETPVNMDTGWNMQALVSGDIGIRATLELCMGIYGKILSLRLCPSVYGGLHAESIPITLVGANNDPTFDLSTSPGVTPKLNWQISSGLFIELSIFDWFKDLFGKLTKSNVGATLSKVSEEAQNGSAWYQDVTVKPLGDFSAYGPGAYMYYPNQMEREEKDEKSSLQLTFGPWDIWKWPTTPWYPCIEDNSFKILRQYNEETQKMMFFGEFTIKDAGVFSIFQDFVPALIIKQGAKEVERIFPCETGTSSRVSSGKSYMFALPNYEDDYTYLAQPCYFRASGIDASPVGIDKGLPFMGTSPSVTIHEITPTGASIDEGFFYEDDEVYPYQYNYYFDISFTVRGADNIVKWGAFEGNNLLSFDYGKAEGTVLRDGTYRMHCYIAIPDNEYNENKFRAFRIYPFFFSKETEDNYHTGPTIWMYISTDGYCKIDDAPVRKF